MTAMEKSHAFEWKDWDSKLKHKILSSRPRTCLVALYRMQKISFKDWITLINQHTLEMVSLSARIPIGCKKNCELHYFYIAPRNELYYFHVAARNVNTFVFAVIVRLLLNKYAARLLDNHCDKSR